MYVAIAGIIVCTLEAQFVHVFHDLSFSTAKSICTFRKCTFCEPNIQSSRGPMPTAMICTLLRILLLPFRMRSSNSFGLRKSLWEYFRQSPDNHPHYNLHNLHSHG